MKRMKRILRIMIGLPLFPIPMVLATYIWLFSNDDTTWKESVGYFTWCLASGDWDKLPE
jgi:urea transporter